MTFFERLCRDTAADRRALLDVPIIRNALRGRITLLEYVTFLEQAYHHVRHTVPLLKACGARLPGSLSWLRDPIARYVAEESGHDQWILADIGACGGDPHVVRYSRPAFETELMVAYAYHGIERGNPIGLFGMVHVLEGTSTAIASDAAAAIRTALGLPAAAFTYLSTHGSLDLEHVRFFEDLVNRFDHACDQDAVIACARGIYRLYAEMFRAIPRYAEHVGTETS